MHNQDYYLKGSTSDYLKMDEGDLLDRLQQLTDWLDVRYQHGVDPYSKSSDGQVLAECQARDRNGKSLQGVNFASQDYLALSCHPKIMQTAKEAVDRFGVHSAGSPALMGNTTASLELEQRLANFTHMRNCTVFPTGWSAGYGLIKGLVGPDDHIVIDQLSHASLMEGARAATSNVHVFPHLSLAGLERRLKRITKDFPSAGILIVTESLFSMDSDSPDIAAHQELAKRYGARLMVDVAHDMGAMGEDGRGVLGEQDMLGKIDLLMGSFSKTFASNGGYVASNHPALKLALRYGSCPLTFSNAMSPVQASVVLAALNIIESSEGQGLRQAVLRNARVLRTGLVKDGFKVLGEPSPIVPVILGDTPYSRLATRYCLEGGGLVNLVEFPAVAKNACRLRLQVMPTHTFGQINQFIHALSQARRRAVLSLDHLERSRQEEALDAG